MSKTKSRAATAEQQATPSTHDGMGAVPYPGGTAFRVWAPHADQVYVSGTFADWAETDYPLASEENGYWSVDVKKARDGDEYRFLIISGEQKLWKIDPYARDVTSSIGNGVIISSDFTWDPLPYQMPAWNELVIYEMHVWTFNDVPGGAPGNLRGVIRKLPHLQDLGVNAIQIMPPSEFAGGFSWGYNPAHIFAIESDYGGPNGLKELIQEAHRLGIAVLFDVVYNHLGPSDLDLWQFDGWSENDKGGIYFYSDWRAETPWGPRPDYGRPEVRQYLRDNTLMWLEEYQADGLRWDATAYIRNNHGNNNDPGGDIPDGWGLMWWINNEINARQPWKISIAEDLRGNHAITDDWGARFDSQWDGNFVHPVREQIITQDDQHRNMYALRDAINHRYSDSALKRVIYTESHDEVANGKARVPQEIWHDQPDSYFSRKRSTLGAAVVFTSPGIPMIFQGQELLEDEWFRDTDPIDWSKKETYRGIYQMYRDLIRLRRNWHDTTRGLRGQNVNVFHVNDYDKLIVYHRWDQGGPRDDVVVVVNMANRAYESYTIGFPREGLWKVRFNSDWNGYSDDFGNQAGYDTVAAAGYKDGLQYHGNIGIGPYSALILSQD